MSPTPASTTALPKDAVPYFAYFANLNPRKIGPMSTIPARRFEILRTDIAILHSYAIEFSAPGFPLEPAFANLCRSSSSSVHGVLHWLRPSDFDRLSLSENVLPSSLPFQQLAQRLSSRVEHIDVVVDGTTVRASTFVFPALAPSWANPSRRYVNVALDGARYWNLDPAYITNQLATIKCDTGPLGGFGLMVEPRPHILDRPNPTEKFGNTLSEIYSPYEHMRAEEALSAFEEMEAKDSDDTIKLVPLTKFSASKKSLYFIPGIDGTGKSILSQISDIEAEGVYNVSAFSYPFRNRESLESLTTSIIDRLLEDTQGRPISIVGESMGGALAILIAIENVRRKERGDQGTMDLDLIMLINPATSYKRSDPRQFWDFLIGLGLSEEAYKTFLPPVLLPFVLDFGSVGVSLDPEFWPRLTKVLTKLPEVSGVLPQSAMSHRLGLLAGLSISDDELKLLGDEHGPKNIASICAINDNLIPSYQESYRLRRAIPGIHSLVLSFGGHVSMFDRRFNLASFLRPFTVDKKPPIANASTALSESALRRRNALRKKFGGRTPDVDAVKTRAQIRRARDYLGPSIRDSSPVFIGEENLPAYDPKKPVLFVSNHTLLGWLDGAFPMLRMLETRDTLLRPLVHPVLFREGMIRFPGAGVNGFSLEELKSFGVGVVRPQLLLEQLARGNWSLLFPGGAAEALKQPGDKKYAVKWPTEPEFIRACALFGATIVPVSTIGTEDMVHIVAGSDVTQKVVDTVGVLLRRNIDLSIAADDAKKWKTGGSGDGNVMLPPIIVPTGADRLYFRFGKPFEVPAECADDKLLEKEVYDEVQKRVEDGVEVLLRRREKDEYRSVQTRKKFAQRYGEDVAPPAGLGWAWLKGNDSYLDDDLQPPL